MSETKSKVSADETLRFAETHVQPALEWWLKRQLQQTRSTIIEASEEERSILQTLETLTKGTYRDPERPPTNLTVRDALALRVERGVEYGGLYDLVDALIMDAYKAGFVFVTRAEAEDTTEADRDAERSAEAWHAEAMEASRVIADMEEELNTLRGQLLEAVESREMWRQTRSDEISLDLAAITEERDRMEVAVRGALHLLDSWKISGPQVRRIRRALPEATEWAQ